MKIKSIVIKKYLVKNKKVFLALLALLLLLTLVYLKKNLFLSASVNGKLITRLSLIKELERQSSDEILEILVNESIIFQEAKKAKIKIADPQVDQEIAKIEENLNKITIYSGKENNLS